MTTERGWRYILRCADGSYYVGSTNDLEMRVAEHASGQGGRYTARLLPVTLVHREVFQTVEEAYDVERQVKGWSRVKKEALIAGRYDQLPGLARAYSRQAHRER